MKILAIDPGYDRCGIAVLERLHNKVTLIFSACITTNKADPFPQRLSEVHKATEQVIHAHPEISSLALENLFFNKNQRTAMHVAEVRGMLIQLGSSHRLPVSEYTPSQVKVAVAGSGRASKADIQKMIPLLLKIPEKSRLDDELDAIAIGITHLACTRV